ncbi:MAG: methylisocitrate lyase, partial [Gammaproteobacteria bacterium]
DHMQTRQELYDYLKYYEFEKKLDALFAQDKNNVS